MSINSKIIITTGIALTGISSLLYYWNHLKRKARNNRVLETIIIRPHTFKCCKNVDNFNFLDCSDSRCPKQIFQKIIKFINGAKNSINIMMYAFTLDEMAAALISARNRGVDVNIIASEDMKSISGCQLQHLKRNGIAVYWPDPALAKIMHHKVCVIDAETELGVAMTGSLNWTRAAFVRNYEHLVIVSNKKVVNELAKEFRDVLRISVVADWPKDN